MESYAGLAPLILSLSTTWRWVVSLRPQLLYPGTHCTGGRVSL